MTIYGGNMEWLTIECMNFNPHEPHTWREGFLWRTKKECGGRPEFDTAPKFPEFGRTINKIREDLGFPKYIPNAALVPMKIVEHKHDYRLKKEFTFGPKKESDLLWKCDWVDCNHYFVTDRKLWWDKGVWYDVY
jgi:hypothetical protein